MTLSTVRGEPAAVLAEAAARARAAESRERLRVRGGIALLGAALLLFWEYGLGFLVEPRYVSSPSEVAVRLAELVADGRLWGHIGVTLGEAGAGYLIGIAVGLAAALLLVAVPVLDEIAGPFLAAFYSIPKIALAPMFIMWFGLGLLPKVLLAALMVFLIVLANTMAGVRGIDPGLIEVSRVLGARGPTLVRTIVLPGAAPAVVASIRLTFSRAMVGAILGEFIAATQGLGFLIVRSSRQFETATVFAGIAVVAALVMLVNAAIRAVEARALPWSAGRTRG
ncbi:ABC transporter permease [Nonomuraea sp. K274]|uniref:ABC transporter permease n=1 Tax=Nonomuraea cypriaca TaxID=1187855 RepID=A0A931F6P1_9ACTN|nr:ABC transporter permease [Nonomuraea cypriaca]MBF8193448.1 ABC transporter permease [Nonomuraea cypriaca]